MVGLAIYFQIRSAACPKGEQLIGARCKLVPALPANIKPGGKGLSGTNPLVDLASLSEMKKRVLSCQLLDDSLQGLIIV